MILCDLVLLTIIIKGGGRFQYAITVKCQSEDKSITIRVCRRGWKYIYATSNNKLRTVVEYMQNPEHFFHGIPIEHRSDVPQLRILAFLDELNQYFGVKRADPKPHKFALIHFYRWTNVHQEYLNWYQLHYPDDEHPPVHYDWFRQIRKKYRSWIGLGSKSQLPRCDLCVLFDETIKKKRNPQVKLNLDQLRKLHLDLQKQERVHYHQRAELSILYPNKFFSFIVDGSMGILLPRFAVPTHDNRQIRFDIIGILNHGQKKKETFWQPAGVFSRDSNPIVTAIHSHVDRGLEDAAKKGHRPWIALMHFDNCTSENKNHYMYGYVEWLLEQGYFSEIYLSYLIPGKTV